MIRAHIEPGTAKILGYYPTEIDYPDLPSDAELVEITDEQHQAALAINANKWTGADLVVDESLFPPPPPPPPELSPEEKLAAVGLTKADLKKLLAE